MVRHTTPKKSPARKAIARLKRVSKAARSGLQRYPRAVLASIRTPIIRPPTLPGVGAIPDLSGHDLAAIWLGHASVLLRVNGVTILTDPVFSQRIGVSIGRMTFGLSRILPPPAAAAALPPVDLVLLSHAHFDHLDKPTLRAIASPLTTVVTARRTSRLIPRGFGRVVEMDWNEDLHIRGVHLSSIRPDHWGARTALDRRRGYNSYLIRSDGGDVLFAGDTAMTRAFDHLDGVRLAVLGIGSYSPWEHTHATPEQAWSMFSAIGADLLLPVHHSTFPMGDEPAHEPMQRLLGAAGRQSHRVIRVAPGEKWVA